MKSDGWVGIRLDAGVDREMVAAVVEDGYREMAPARCLALLDGD